MVILENFNSKICIRNQYIQNSMIFVPFANYENNEKYNWESLENGVQHGVREKNK